MTAVAVLGAGAAVALAITRPWEPAPGVPETEHFAAHGVWITDPPEPEPVVDGVTFATMAEWEDHVAAVRAVDPDAFVSLTAPVLFTDREGSRTPLIAYDGPLPAGALVEGRAPASGEVVVSVRYRDEHGWELGDRLDLAAAETGEAPFESLEVVGFSPEETHGFAAWEDAVVLARAYSIGDYGLGNDFGDAVVADGSLWWNGAIPEGLEDSVVPWD
ncbi:MAG: hypothetical protein ACLGHM_06330 [Actinomycetes bacterium]